MCLKLSCKQKKKGTKGIKLSEAKQVFLEMEIESKKHKEEFERLAMVNVCE